MFGGDGFVPSTRAAHMASDGGYAGAGVYSCGLSERSVQRVPETPSLWQTQRSSKAPSSVDCRLNFSCKLLTYLDPPLA